MFETTQDEVTIVAAPNINWNAGFLNHLGSSSLVKSTYKSIL